jgi:hypothetical protein
LITTDAKMAVCNKLDLPGCQVDLLIDGVNYDKIVAQPVHFHKREHHNIQRTA